MAKKVVLPGGSGFLGQSLANYLIEKGYEVVVLTRRTATSSNHIKYVQWDGKTINSWTLELEGCEAIVNLTGKSVNCIYTPRNKAEIISSRVDSVRVLKQAIRACKNPPKAFIQAGSLAIFGDTTAVCNEESVHGTGFSVQVCQRWEEEFFTHPLPETRQAVLRIGFALAKNGGALQPLEKLARLNLGGTIGSGKQYISWIHIEDLNQMFLTAIENSQITGAYNATGPRPVTNQVFMKALRTALGKGWAAPAPSPLVWLGAYVVMRADPGLALTGRNCIPAKFTKSGFVFKYVDLETTLKEIYAGWFSTN
ncbi:TIGR01777 family oxidoreductase [Aneurinibacillus sp. Ricciae_BoGa-3]|uniref:TIGR01777 family oxidoreductase n=1 Tax=Aneurinibacillus sp. Ricciae_BoGa-3 TaxID=3022697 RepID=UPI00234117AA|nr:TIGR01777 family oxidoreductase [Aneurinibacillus sp. Ricciae_BoGa-3]WCK54210.1 TIGR01777 family oxidoreductase [Aneurinibacillus sp. Ricciae_BoGa-3]